MLKLLAFILLGVLFLRSIAYLFRLLIGGAMAQRGSQFNSDHRRSRPSDGKLNVDHIPRKKNEPKDFGGGEYVDYEEVD